MPTNPQYKDGNGIAFADYRNALPKRASDFRKAKPIKNPELLRDLHADWRKCMVCGRMRQLGVTLQLHHIAHGTCGRSDEATNIAMLCNSGPDAGCHSDVHGGKISPGRLLYCRWYAEPDTVDWVRLAILFRHFLPDLILKQEIP